MKEKNKRTICGTPNYIAPEVLSSRIGHSYEVDLWSIGVILYTMLVGRPPFETSNVKTTYKRIRMNFYTFPDHITISKEAKDLVQNLLKKEPEWRLSLDQVMSHDFFSGEYPQTLPVSAVAWPPPPELYKTSSMKTTSDESEKPSLRPQSSNREVVTQRWNIFLDKEKNEISKDSRGWSQNNKGMLLSNRWASPFNTEFTSAFSKPDTRNKSRERRGDRVGSAIHRCMTRTRTEQILMTARNRLGSKDVINNEPESQFSKYKSKLSTNPSKPSTSVSKMSRYDSKHKISTVRDTVDYNTESQKKAGVKVEYASTLGPSESSKILITKWVDYSSKYGIGYKMSNGWYGVLYNDSTKMLLNENWFDFIYIRRESSSRKESLEGLSEHYDFENYPEALKKKVVLLQHFKSYLDGVKFEIPRCSPGPKTPYGDIFLKKWRRAKKAILFRLSSKVIQVIFQDLSELILSSGSGNVTFIKSKGEVRNTPLYQDLENKDPSLFKRLNYAKEILVHMINPQKQSEAKIEKENNGTVDGAKTTRSKIRAFF